MYKYKEKRKNKNSNKPEPILQCNNWIYRKYQYVTSGYFVTKKHSKECVKNSIPEKKY